MSFTQCSVLVFIHVCCSKIVNPYTMERSTWQSIHCSQSLGSASVRQTNQPAAWIGGRRRKKRRQVWFLVHIQSTHRYRHHLMIISLNSSSQLKSPESTRFTGLRFLGQYFIISLGILTATCVLSGFTLIVFGWVLFLNAHRLTERGSVFVVNIKGTTLNLLFSHTDFPLYFKMKNWISQFINLLLYLSTR